MSMLFSFLFWASTELYLSIFNYHYVHDYTTGILKKYVKFGKVRVNYCQQIIIYSVFTIIA